MIIKRYTPVLVTILVINDSDKRINENNENNKIGKETTTENNKSARNLRAVDRYSPEDMHTCLKKLAEEGELTLEEIPTVKTIKGWIGRYSANFKKEASEKALVGSMENSQNTLASEGSIS
ncbi:hypothetical protein GLOIN_2v1485655 [Rhizophagus clarus]|uniref:Uncharacterized protein n=1 Tax=Rhizophagus clarus TaxID=94130 RepID=A0A8H3L050_9GLOM|nr:hypothetical protein GLOIN_2v1485655 [Rhizophagus clarus]